MLRVPGVEIDIVERLREDVRLGALRPGLDVVVVHDSLVRSLLLVAAH